MKFFSKGFLDELTIKARANKRGRQHSNIHDAYHEPCQRLFNAIEPGSYIRPHRHTTDPKIETLVAVRGIIALITFNEQGEIRKVIRFGSEKHSLVSAVGVEVPANTWHTVVALESGSVLLELKAGPFDPSLAKDLAPWAPLEGSPSAVQYLEELYNKSNMIPDV